MSRGGGANTTVDKSNVVVHEFVAHDTQVNCLCFGPKSNQVLATGGEDCKVNIWRVDSATQIWSLGYNKSPIECVCFDSEEMCVVSGSMNGSIKVFDLNVGKLARNLGNHNVNVSSLQYHPYGEFVASGSVDCTMKVWDVRNKSCIQTYNGHTKEVTCVRFSPDGKWVASSSKDGQILLWDLVAGKLINSIKLSPNYVRSFEFNPTELTMAAITSARSVKFYDLEVMQPIYHTPPESNPVRAIAYSNLGTTLCSAARDTLKVWELEEPSLRQRSAIDAGWDRIQDMKISNNSQLIAGSCASNFVSIWSIDLEFSTTDEEKGPIPTAVGTTSPPPVRNNFSEQQQQQQLPRRNSRAEEYDSRERRVSRDFSSVQSKQQQSDSAPGSQLDQVRQQLDQLSSVLGLDVAQQKSVSSHSRAGIARNSIRRNDEVCSSDSELSGNDGRAAVSKRHSAAVDPTGKRLERAESKYYDGDISNPEDKDVKASMLPDIPEVVWDAGGTSEDLAMSMGESFWNRFKQTPKDPESIAAARAAAAALKEDLGDGDLRDDDEESDWGATPAGICEDNSNLQQQQNHLKQLLPPSAYEDDRAAKSVDRDSSTSDSRRPPTSQRPPSTSNRNGRAIATAGGRDAVVISPRPDSPDLPPKKPAVPVFAKPRIRTPGGGNSEYEDNSSYDSKSDYNLPLGGGLQVVGVRHLRGNSNSDISVDASSAAAAVYQNNAFPASAPRAARKSPLAGDGSNHNLPSAISNIASSSAAEKRKCEDLLERMFVGSGPTASQLSQRLSSLRILRQLWSKGEVLDAIEHLTILSDALPHSPTNVTTLADFFNAIELRGNGLSLDACVKLMPLIETMLGVPEGYTSEHVVCASFRALNSLCEAFGELIRSTRSMMLGGVDLSREARLNKCNACHAVVQRVTTRVNPLMRRFRISKTVLEILHTFNSFAATYFRE